MNPIGALDALKLYHELISNGDIQVSSEWTLSQQVDEASPELSSDDTCISQLLINSW